MRIDIGSIESVGLLATEVKLTKSLWCKLFSAVPVQVMLKAYNCLSALYW